jgi:hypothetical protein
MSSTLLGAGSILYPQRSAWAQDRPPATELLDRGARLYDQKNYAEARKILADIDLAQLPEDLRQRRTDLLAKTDQALAMAMAPNERLTSAQQDTENNRLASAALKLQAVLGDSKAPADIKNKATMQLDVVKQKQITQAPKMRQLLDQVGQ